MLVTRFLSFSHNDFHPATHKCIARDSVNSLPNDKILDWSKLKVFADDKLNAIKTLKFVMDVLKKIVEKGENGRNQHFVLFPQCFQKASFLGVVKKRNCVVKSNLLFTKPQNFRPVLIQRTCRQQNGCD